MASRVAGSSHESGRWTTRDGNGVSAIDVQLLARLAQCVGGHAGGEPTTVDLHQERPDASGGVDETGAEVLVRPRGQCLDPQSQAEVEGLLAELDEDEAIAGLADRDGGLVAARFVAGDDRRRQDGAVR